MTNYSLGVRASVTIEDIAAHAGETSPLTAGLTALATSNRSLAVEVPTDAHGATTTFSITPAQLQQLADMHGPHATDDRINALARFLVSAHLPPSGARAIAARVLSTVHEATSSEALASGGAGDLTVRLRGFAEPGHTPNYSQWLDVPIAAPEAPTTASRPESPHGRRGHRTGATAAPTPLSQDQLASALDNLSILRRSANADLGFTYSFRNHERSVSAAQARGLNEVAERLGDRLFMPAASLTAAERADVASFRQLLDRAFRGDRAAATAFLTGDRGGYINTTELHEHESTRMRAETEALLQFGTHAGRLCDRGVPLAFTAPDGRIYELDRMALRRLQSAALNGSDTSIETSVANQLQRELAALGYHPSQRDLYACVRTMTISARGMD